MMTRVLFMRNDIQNYHVNSKSMEFPFMKFSDGIAQLMSPRFLWIWGQSFGESKDFL